MSETKSAPSEVRDGQRIAKVMARAGLCSRRDAEVWIAEGRVSVNGKILESPAFNVAPEDDVRVDGQRLREAERTRLFFFHKPRGLVTTARDPEGRTTIFEALPEDLPRVVAVGRLDINTEGLLLLTNDGGLARVLELPATGWLRRYRVRAHGEVTQAQLDALREGVTIEGIHYAGIEARLEREQGSNVWIMMGLREGKNREIKRVLEHLGLSVNRLIRVSFGPFELGDLPEGAVAELNTRILRDQLGLKLAKQANANFDAPAESRPVVAAPRPSERPRDGARPARERREGGRPPMRPKEDRGEIARELAARGERPETAKPRQRKHVSALRAEAGAEAAGPRKRTERSATSDRKGREIKVERIMNARVAEAAPARGRGPREGRDDRAERSAPKRDLGAKREGAPAREGRPFRSGPRAAEGGPREAREARPERSGPKRDFGAKREAAPAREGRPFRAAPRTAEGGAREGREARPERSGPKRDFGAKRDGAPAREGRPFRAAPRTAEGGGREGREARPERSGPKRDFGAKRDAGEGRPAREGRAPPRGGKPFGKPGGRPSGKPSGQRPPRKS